MLKNLKGSKNSGGKYLKKKSGRIVEEIETSFGVIDYITVEEAKKICR